MKNRSVIWTWNRRIFSWSPRTSRSWKWLVSVERTTETLNRSLTVQISGWHSILKSPVFKVYVEHWCTWPPRFSPRTRMIIVLIFGRSGSFFTVSACESSFTCRAMADWIECLFGRPPFDSSDIPTLIYTIRSHLPIEVKRSSCNVSVAVHRSSSDSRWASTITGMPRSLGTTVTTWSQSTDHFPTVFRASLHLR